MNPPRPLGRGGFTKHGMAYKRKTAIEELHDKKDLPKIVKLKGEAARRWAGNKLAKNQKTATLAIPAPIEVDKIMKKVPKGQVITINDIREKIAKKHKAIIGCPIVCGISAWISAYAAEEEKKMGKKNTTPWWRTVKQNGELNEKYPGGALNQKNLLEKEGHKIIQKGKKYFVLSNFISNS